MPASNRRVVITGAGQISPFGNTPEALWEGLRSGRSAVGPLTQFPTTYLPLTWGAEARDFQGKIEDFGPLDRAVAKSIKKGQRLMCREIEMGVASSQRALAAAGLGDPAGRNPDRTGVVFGSDYILTLPDEFAAGLQLCRSPGGFDFAQWGPRGLPKVSPLWLLKYLPNMPASHVAIYNDLRGPNNSLTMREASGNLALAEAYNTLLRGSADVLLVGSTGTRLHPLRTLHMLLQEQVAQGPLEAELASCPFDRRRCGMVLGEGAATLVLETYEHAAERGATLWGELIGYGMSTVTSPRGVADLGRAIENALRMALTTAGLSPADVGHVHAHGLSTQHADHQEAEALARVFGPGGVPVVAAKSFFGNLGAGGGLVELLASLLALRQGELFAREAEFQADPACPVRLAQPGEPAGEVALNVSVTPQGQASVVAVRRCE